jgi:hypothetical protein
MKGNNLTIYEPSLFSAMVYLFPATFLLVAGGWLGYRGIDTGGPKLVVGLIFIFSGLLIAAFGLIPYLRQKRKFDLHEKYPSQPWKIFPYWQSFSIRSQEFRKIFKKFWLALFFVGLSWLSGMMMFGSDEYIVWYLKLFIYFIFLATIGVVSELIAQIWRYLKFGESQIVLAKKPLIPGQETAVRIFLPKNAKQGAFKLKLYLNEVRVTDETREKKVFENSFTVNRKPGDVENGLAFISANLTIPEETNTSQPDGNHRFEWWLQVSAPEGGGVGMKTEFHLPVFRVSNEKYIEHNPVKI